MFRAIILPILRSTRLVLLRMGKIIARNMLSWLKLLIKLLLLHLVGCLYYYVVSSWNIRYICINAVTGVVLSTCPPPFYMTWLGWNPLLSRWCWQLLAAWGVARLHSSRRGTLWMKHRTASHTQGEFDLHLRLNGFWPSYEGCQRSKRPLSMLTY